MCVRLGEPIVPPMTERLSYGPWQRAAFVSFGLLLLVVAGIIWGLSTSRNALAALAAAACAIGGVLICANAFLMRMELRSEGFRVAGLWRRSWSWSDVERFYVHQARGVELVGYVPTARYESTHVIARIVAALNLGAYSVPALGMDASRQVGRMNEWLRKYREQGPV